MKERSPFADVLQAGTLKKLASDAALWRGRACMADRRVHAVVRYDCQIVGLVQGLILYSVSLWVRADRLGYSCTCLAGAKGAFCEHCVAVALTWILGRG